jgi:hypothetical protein
MHDVNDFVNTHPFMTFIEFDNYVSHEITLFSIDPNLDFNQLETSIQKIRKSLPSLKRIFVKPIISLKDVEDVMPVENTRIINQKTFLHLANHSHNVANITKRGVKPRRLLTRLNEDDYGIYENIVFCNTVDAILAYVRKNRRMLENVLYASDMMEFNILEKMNHMNFFLALGKLQTGYIRDFNQYLSLSRRLLHDLAHIDRTLKARLSKPVYKKNKRRNKRIRLKKTNIFLKQKDYRQTFKMYKFMRSKPTETQADKPQSWDEKTLTENYLRYVQMLMLFAIGHFNFKRTKNTKMDLKALDTSFNNKEWTLDVKATKRRELLLTFKKDTSYTMLLTDKHFENGEGNEPEGNGKIDETIYLSPVSESYLKREDVYVNVDDINSFRRLQQLLLKGMIYSDTKRDVCPFCGGTLKKHKRHALYQCQDCMLQINEAICSETGQFFVYTDNANQRKQATLKTDSLDDDDYYVDKKIESLMFFRNITKISEEGKIICPHCNKVHDS